MKRSRFLLFSILLTIAYVNHVKAQINPTSPITEDKIIVNVTINVGIQGLPVHTVQVVQSPSHLISNDPLPFEMHYENHSSTPYYLHIDHLGSEVQSESQNSGGVQPVRVPPNGTGNSVSQIIHDQLPQEAARYLFGSGDHKLTFRLLDTDNTENLGHIARDQISFSINLLPIIYSHSTSSDLSIYPNPFINDVTFGFTDITPQLKDTFITISIYDQNGRIQDQLKKDITSSSKIVYQNNSLPKGRYYYTITSEKGQKIDSGILLKE